ncbi:MAG: hypothetical protein HOJ06_20690, partial [Rhodospirillaceae bacterium]|nr:hypothetical protein [Rhodospirillaceae bacterium]
MPPDVQPGRGLAKRARLEIMVGVALVAAILVFAWVKADRRDDTAPESSKGSDTASIPADNDPAPIAETPTGKQRLDKRVIDHPSLAQSPLAKPAAKQKRAVTIPGLVKPFDPEPPPPLVYAEPPPKRILTPAEKTERRRARVLRLSAQSIEHTRRHDAVSGALLALEALSDMRDVGEAAKTTLFKALYAAYLNRREIGVLKGHYRYVRKAVYNPDGARLATVSSDGNIRLWDPRTGAEIAKMDGHDDEVWDAAFTPDGRWLATASFDGTARLWNADTGAEVEVFKGHDDKVAALAIAPNGRFLATGSYDGAARIWDLESHDLVAVLRGHGDKLRSVAFSPDSKRVVTASDDATARIWDAATGRELAVLRGHTSFVRHAIFSPDGKRVATASADDTARLWRVDEKGGALIADLKGHRSWVDAVAFSPDGARLATTSRDKTARLWNGADGSLVAVLRGHESWVNAAVFNPDGETLLTASSDRTARRWAARDGAAMGVLAGHQGEIWSLSISPDGHNAATASGDGGARIWAIDPAERAAQKATHHALWSRTDNGVFTVSVSNDGRARLTDATTGADIATLPGPAKTAAFSPDGQRIVVMASDGTGRVYAVFNTLETLAATLKATMPRKLTRDQLYKY